MLSDVTLSDSLVLCTRNRPDEVAGCLASVRAQLALPAEVFVVDSSDGDETRAVVERAAAAWPPLSRLDYIASVPALTQQRIVGIAATTREIIHFVDDDVLLEPGYLDAVLRAFAEDAGETIAGVGGVVTNQRRGKVRRLDAWLQLDSAREGVVLPSGRNVRVWRELAGPIDVEWLLGAAMSYRRSALVREPPNEAFPFEGEDVELSSRIARHGRLVVTPAARFVHLESATNRVVGVEQVANELTSRYHRVCNDPDRLSKRAFWISAWGQGVKFGVAGAATLSTRRLSIAKGTLRAVGEIRRAGGRAAG